MNIAISVGLTAQQSAGGTAYNPQTALENLFDLTPNVWTEYNSSGASISGNRTALTFTDTSGNGEARMVAHILDDVLTQRESGGSFTFSFWSPATTRILIRAGSQTDYARDVLYDSTGGHGSPGSPVTLTTPFSFNIDPKFRVRLQILCLRMAANGTSVLNDISVNWTPA